MLFWWSQFSKMASKGENLNWLPMNLPFLQKNPALNLGSLQILLLQFSQACKTKYFSCFVHQRSERLGKSVVTTNLSPFFKKKYRTEPWLLTNDIETAQLSQTCKTKSFSCFIHLILMYFTKYRRKLRVMVS